MKKTVKQVETEKFDFKTIDSKEAAFKKCGIDISILESMAALIPDERFRNAQISSFILMVGFKAINEDWIPDYSDKSQLRYYPWPFVSSHGLDFANSGYDCDDAGADVGSCLCTNSYEKEQWHWKVFQNEWKTWLLNVKPK